MRKRFGLTALFLLNLASCASPGLPPFLLPFQKPPVLSPLGCPSGVREVLIPMDSQKVRDQDGFGICGQMVLANALGVALKEEISPLCLALSTPGEGKGEMEDELWFEGVNSVCDALKNVQKHGKGVARAKDVIFDQLPGDASAQFLKLMLRYREQLRQLSEMDKLAFRARLTEAAEQARAQCLEWEKSGKSEELNCGQLTRNLLADFMKKEVPACSPGEDVFLGMPDQTVEPLFKAIERVTLATGGDREFLRGLIGCDKNPLRLPRGLSCETIARLDDFPGTGEITWSSSKIKVVQSSIPTTRSKPPVSIVAFEPDLSKASLGFGLVERFIRKSVDDGKLVSISVCGKGFEVSKKNEKTALETDCVSEFVEPNGQTQKSFTSDHYVSLIGYRTQRLRGGDCKVEYKIRNSWGADCSYLKPALQKNCDPTTGDFWVSQDLVEKFSDRVDALKL